MLDKYIPFITTKREILNQVENQNLLCRPNLMRSDPCKRDSTKYCRFYKDHIHDIEDCIGLKEEIENLIRRGRLRLFVACSKGGKG